MCLSGHKLNHGVPSEETRRKSRFVVGPWHHGGAPSGDLDYPNEARLAYKYERRLEWFDFQLKGKPYQTN